MLTARRIWLTNQQFVPQEISEKISTFSFIKDESTEQMVGNSAQHYQDNAGHLKQMKQVKKTNYDKSKDSNNFNNPNITSQQTKKQI